MKLWNLIQVLLYPEHDVDDFGDAKSNVQLAMAVCIENSLGAIACSRNCECQSTLLDCSLFFLLTPDLLLFKSG